MPSRGWLLWALLVCFRSVLLVRARGPALRLGACLLGFPAAVCAATPIPALASLEHSMPCALDGIACSASSTYYLATQCMQVIYPQLCIR